MIPRPPTARRKTYSGSFGIDHSVVCCAIQLFGFAAEENNRFLQTSEWVFNAAFILLTPSFSQRRGRRGGIGKRADRRATVLHVAHGGVPSVAASGKAGEPIERHFNIIREYSVQSHLVSRDTPPLFVLSGISFSLLVFLRYRWQI